MRTGADPPWRDPRRWHGVAMEGYLWRVTQARTGDVAVVYSAVCQGGWGLVGLAAHAGGRAVERWAVGAPVWGDPHGLGARIGNVLHATEGHVRVQLVGARLDVDHHRAAPVRRRLHTMGVAHLIPGLPQYWHAHVLAGETSGRLVFDDVRADFSGARLYAEKNWSASARGFPARWWWGHAHDFGEPGVSVSFAGGPVAGVPATAAVVAVGGRLLRALPPGRAEIAPGAWRVRARAGAHTIAIEGAADPAHALLLQVPVPGERRTEPRSHHHLAGTLHLRVRRRGRTVFDGESALAGLEQGGAVDPQPSRDASGTSRYSAKNSHQTRR